MDNILQYSAPDIMIVDTEGYGLICNSTSDFASIAFGYEDSGYDLSDSDFE